MLLPFTIYTSLQTCNTFKLHPIMINDIALFETINIYSYTKYHIIVNNPCTMYSKLSYHLYLIIFVPKTKPICTIYLVLWYSIFQYVVTWQIMTKFNIPNNTIISLYCYSHNLTTFILTATLISILIFW